MIIVEDFKDEGGKKSGHLLALVYPQAEAASTILIYEW